MRILLVEDDSLLGEGLHAGLSRESYRVDWVKNGESALLAIQDTEYDAMVLDIGLPKMDGRAVLQQARGQGFNLPVLILTAQDDLSSRVEALDGGADDYLSKPFEFEELCARLRALTRRARGLTEQTIDYKNIILNPAAHTVTIDNTAVNLSRREFALLEELLSGAGRVRSRSYLENKIYSWGDEIESNAIEVHIHHLRKRFGQALIKTVRGVGYMVPKD